MSGFFKKFGLGFSGLVASVATFAQESGGVSLPETGVDLEGYASAGITYLGGIIAVVVGGTIAFILIRAGIRWIRGMK